MGIWAQEVAVGLGQPERESLLQRLVVAQSSGHLMCPVAVFGGNRDLGPRRWLAELEVGDGPQSGHVMPSVSGPGAGEMQSSDELGFPVNKIDRVAAQQPGAGHPRGYERPGGHVADVE